MLPRRYHSLIAINELGAWIDLRFEHFTAEMLQPVTTPPRFGAPPRAADARFHAL